MPDAPKIKMKSLTDHTYEGIARPAGTVYEIEPQYEETITLLKYAVRADAPAATEAHTHTESGREPAAHPTMPRHIAPPAPKRK